MTSPRGAAARAAAIAAAKSSMRRTSIAFTGSSGRSITILATPDASAGTNVAGGRGLGGGGGGFFPGGGGGGHRRGPGGSRRASPPPRQRARAPTARRP